MKSITSFNKEFLLKSSTELEKSEIIDASSIINKVFLLLFFFKIDLKKNKSRELTAD